MSNFDKQWRKIPNRFGLITAVLFTAYFLIMRFAGLGHEYWLRALNIVLLSIGIYYSIKAYKKEATTSIFESFFDYFKIGMRTAFIGIGLFALFLAIYLDQIDTAFYAELEQLESFGGRISPVSVAFLIFFEGMGSAFVCTYLAIQLLKTKTVEKPISDKEEFKKEMKATR